MTNLKQHKKSIKNRKYNKNDYDNHNVIFAYDINCNSPPSKRIKSPCFSILN